MHTRIRVVLFSWLLLLSAGASGQHADYTIGPWRLGMSPSEVTNFKAHGPYSPVRTTGGLETRRAKLDRGRTNVSFVFDGDRLDYIQVWYFEGKRYKGARAAALEVFDLFTARFGGASVPGVAVNGAEKLTRADAEIVLDRVLGTSAELGKKMAREGKGYGTFRFDLVPATQPPGSKLVGQFGYSTRHDTYYVFLFQDDPSKPDRRVRSNIHVEAL
jgi:hypothetical protein